ncbi:hypothetical protein V6N13_007716 [Hibiscus sabdariffa]
MKMKMKSCINLSAFLGLFVVHILIIIMICSCHGERNQQNPRKLLIISSMASTSFGAGGSKLNAGMKEPKKAVDPSLRTAPTSVPNPTHN